MDDQGLYGAVHEVTLAHANRIGCASLCQTMRMAREVIVRMTDDLDRSKLADETRDLTFEGVVYTLDLCSDNLDRLRETLRPWLEAAHEKTRQIGGHKKSSPASSSITPRGGVSPSAISKATKEERNRIRDWARENGYEVGEKGIISRVIIDAYHAAQIEIKAPEKTQTKAPAAARGK